MSYACTKHKIVICDCYGNKVLDLESRLAERKKEIERLRKALKAMYDHFGPLDDNPLISRACVRACKLAEAALERRDEGEGAPVKEILYTGQCRHQIPIGQHCQGCNR